MCLVCLTVAAGAAGVAAAVNHIEKKRKCHDKDVERQESVVDR